MRSTSKIPLILLLSWTTSSSATPIPIPDNDCLGYASCKPSPPSPQLSTTPQWKESYQLAEPHFPAHQLGSPKQTDTVEVRLLEHHTTAPQIVIQSELPTKNPKLNTVLESARRDKLPSQMSLYEQDLSSTNEAELPVPNYPPSAKDLAFEEYGFTAKMLKKVQLVSITSGPKCTMGNTISSRDGRMIVTYTYGYHYIRTDYTSVLVVSIVVTFFLVIIMVELLDKAIDASRAALGCDQGAIRLEDGDYENCGVCPPYSCTVKSPEEMIEPPPRYEGLLAEKPQEEAAMEKIPVNTGDELV